MADFPLGGDNKDFDSKRSRGGLANLIAEGSKDGVYRSIRRTEGLTEYLTIDDGFAVRSNLLINDDWLYFVSGNVLYRINIDLTLETLGNIGLGKYRAQLEQNSAPGGNQICILNGGGDGYIYTVGGALVQITDPDFFPSTSVTILNERFWFSRDGTNEFFGSEISDGLSYDPLTFGTAEESPDHVVRVIAMKSSLWVLGQRTGQYYQSINDAVFPLRSVRGTTKQRGIAAHDSLAEIGNNFAFLADDGTVRMITDTQMTDISTLDLELKIKGNGTKTFPGFLNPEDAQGFFIDGPVHKVYVLNFQNDSYTWCFDINTGFDHQRASEGEDYYRIGASQIFDSKIIVGDNFKNNLWVLDPDAKSENGNIQRITLTTPSISHDKNITIPLIEIDMEVGQPTGPDIEPKMIVRYSKDGGYNWTNWGHIELGDLGDYRKRVPLRRFGRLVRNKDFILRLECTDPVRIQFYGASWEPEVSM